MKRKEGPYFLIFLLLVALFTLTKVLLQDVLGAEWSSCLTVWGIVTAVMIEFIYSANDGFFWYNAGVHYVGMHSFLSFAFDSRMDKVIQENRKSFILSWGH